jgi:hypothetical protein
MEFENPEFCEKSEFDSSKKIRLMEGVLEIDVLYTALFALKKVTAIKNREAVKYPVRIIYKERQNAAGLYIINFSLLNGDLKTMTETKMKSFDGLLTCSSNDFNAKDPSTDPPGIHPIELGYFKKYENPQNDTDENEAPVEIYLPTQELVLA